MTNTTPLIGLDAAHELSNPLKRRGYRRTAQLASEVASSILRELAAGDTPSLKRIELIARAMRGDS